MRTADARGGLAQLGHPAGESSEGIWAASHDRAVVEAGWGHLMTFRRLELPPFDIWELLRMLPYPDQWLRLHWWVWRLRAAMTVSEGRAVGQVAEGVVAARGARGDPNKMTSTGRRCSNHPVKRLVRGPGGSAGRHRDGLPLVVVVDPVRRRTRCGRCEKRRAGGMPTFCRRRRLGGQGDGPPA